MKSAKLTRQHNHKNSYSINLQLRCNTIANLSHTSFITICKKYLPVFEKLSFGKVGLLRNKSEIEMSGSKLVG